MKTPKKFQKSPCVFDMRQPNIRLRSNLTPLARKSGKVTLTCPVCGISFDRQSSQIRPGYNSYCSPECGHEAQKIPIKCECIICGREFIVKPSSWFKRVTCGRDECVISRKVIQYKGIERSGRAIALIGYCNTTGESRYFESMAAASDYLHCDPSLVSVAVNKRNRTASGWMLKRADRCEVIE